MMSCIALFFAASLTTGKDRPDARLKTVTSIFVSGNNQIAEGARATLQSNKMCFTLATKAEDADAVMAIEANSQSQGGTFGGFGARRVEARRPATFLYVASPTMPPAASAKRPRGETDHRRILHKL
jgi:hypothetical protein